MSIIYGLDPVINTNTEILLVGTLPGPSTLQTGKYYSDPGNTFWKILDSIFMEDMPTDYIARCEYLLNKNIGIWDVLMCAERKGSTDKGITNGIVNDFMDLVIHYPSLKKIIILGTTAHGYYKSGMRQGKIPKKLTYQVVQSSSATPGRHVLPLDQKIIQWKSAILSIEST